MAFRLYDIDKNKLIDPNEFETIIKIIYDLTEENHEEDSLNKAINKTKNIIKKFGNLFKRKTQQIKGLFSNLR
jgi:hypothetical protein